jgi:uncharacterized protein (TIGR02147 family)
MQLDTASSTMEPPSVSSYSDFRLYLKDYYEYRRHSENSVRPYSYSNFSAAADIKSPNYLKLIIETEEFRRLVRYGQATDPLERNRYLRELSEYRAKRHQDGAAAEAQEAPSSMSWLNWVIYAMADQEGVDFEPEAIQKKLRRHVTLDQIKGALNELRSSGQLIVDEAGRWQKNRVPQDRNIPVEVIRKLQSELIYLGLESFFKDDPMDREFGAFTLALTEEEFQKVRFELRKVRKALQKEIMVNREHQKGQRVYQLNIQLFPITDPIGEGGQPS